MLQYLLFLLVSVLRLLPVYANSKFPSIRMRAGLRRKSVIRARRPLELWLHADGERAAQNPLH